MKKKMLGCLTAAILVMGAVPAGLPSSPQKAYACSKGEVTTPEYDYSAANQVFYGMVNTVEDVYFGGELFRMATFVVDTNLKGRYTRTVLTPVDSDRCGVEFVPGTSYLVFADNRAGYPAAGAFSVFTGDEALRRLAIVKELEAAMPLPESGEHRVTLYPGSKVTVTLDGRTIPVTPGSLIYKDMLYVPATFFRDTLGYVTVWNEEAKRYDILLRSEWAGIAAQGDQAQAAFRTGSRGIPPGNEPFEAGVTYSDVQAKVDGKRYSPEHMPFVYDGVVFVPLRDTAEKLGVQVGWDAASNTAALKDTRPIDRSDHPVLELKLTSSAAGVPDLIVDRIENDQAFYRVDRPLQYGETAEQLSAPFLDLVNSAGGRSIRLFLKTGERENELAVSKGLADALLTDPVVRVSLSLTLGRDFFAWPEDYVIRRANIH